MKKKEIWDWGKAFLIAIGVAAFIRTFFFALYLVNGESMETTIHNKERIIVNKWSYLMGQPERGDIVVLHALPGEDFIKRVIAKGGDQVEVRNDTLIVNGKTVAEPYLTEQKQKARENGYLFTSNFGPVTIPEGSVFVLGDNRSDSLDSVELGPIEIEKVVGRADVVFFPFTKMRLLNY